MKKLSNLVHHGKEALRMLNRGPATHDPYEAYAYRRLRRQAAERLGSAAAAARDNLSLDVANDIMRLVKKLSTNERGSNEFDRLKQVFDLLEYVVDKKRPTSTDALLYDFYKLYRGLEPAWRREEQRTVAR